MAQGWQPLTTLDWKNSPDTTTPLNANNLNNKVSGFIGELDERTRTLDNVKLDINDAGGIVARAEDGAETSEAYAIGTRSGIPVTSDDPAYHNSSKYYSEQSGDEALRAEGYANGKQNGVPVGSSSPYYHNNAEYFKDQASQIAAQQLGALTDVDITTPQNGEVLTYDSTEQKWVNGQGGVSTLGGLSDVSITTPTDGQVLTYDSNAGEWVNANPTGGGDLEDLGDVNITTPTNGQVLKYDSGTQKWINAAESGGGGGVDGNKTIAPIETTNTASRAYRNGEIFIDANGYTSIPITTIASGATLTLDTNYKHITLGELNGFGTLYTESPDGVKTWKVMLNNVYAYLSTLQLFFRHRCQLYMNRHIYRMSYDYGATQSYTSMVFSNTGVSFHELQPTTSTSSYRVKNEDGTFSTLTANVADQIILVVINYL